MSKILLDLIGKMRSFFVACFLLQTSLSLALSLDANSLAKRYFGNDSPWYLNTIPFFETSDGQIQDVYYYRWKIFRSHQRDLGSNGFISTEFLDDVGWQTQPYGTLNDATAFHIQGKYFVTVPFPTRKQC